MTLSRCVESHGLCLSSREVQCISLSCWLPCQLHLRLSGVYELAYFRVNQNMVVSISKYIY
jgi:hypothetical protein